MTFSSSHSVTNQLKVLLIMTTAILVIMSILMGGYLFNKMYEIQKLQTQLVRIKESALLIHNLQIERGLSGGFIGSSGKKFKEELKNQRLHTDSVLSVIDLKIFDHKERQTLLKIRHSIDIHAANSLELFDTYTAFIGKMRSNSLAQISTVRNFQMRNQLQAYTNLIATKEAMGQIRATMSAILSQRLVDYNLFLRISRARAEFDIARERFIVLAAPKQKQSFEVLCASPNCYWTLGIVDDLITKKYTNRYVDPIVWFSRSTAVINNLYTLEKEFFTSFDVIIERELETMQRALLYGLIILLGIISVSLLLGYKISRSIEKNIRILDEYKQAVDRSSIVSKTNLKGIITYVNDEFCNISGYTKEELMGKPHNIVRHPDMPKSAFKEMWKTILDKKPWYGTVKNKAKDGSFYWVNVTINPILDNEGNIEEFMAIRNDITETVKLHEELERTQEDMIMRIGQVGETRSLETGYHVQRVAAYSRILAIACGLSNEDIHYLSDASPMHDIGKIGIPDSILHKEGALTEEEWVIMRSHAEIGYRFFSDSDSPLLKAAAIIAYEHHEKWDGSGYPRRLKGEEIHIYGRITALADVFDALGSSRCYKKAWDNEKIFDLFKKERGKHFDPALVDLFFDHIDEFINIQSHHTDKSAYMLEAML